MVKYNNLWKVEEFKKYLQNRIKSGIIGFVIE